jgi:peptidoglycan DL-endopeptidase CwlO
VADRPGDYFSHPNPTAHLEGVRRGFTVSESATGRHRASQRTSTPLATLTGSLSVVGDYVGSVRRSGVIIAMSSGLVASMAMPAHAVNDAPEAFGPMTASIPMVPGTTAGEALFTAPEGGLLALPPDLATDETTIAAPAAATVDFDHSSFTVVTDAGTFAPRGEFVPRGDSSAPRGEFTPRTGDQQPQTRRERRQAAPGGDTVVTTRRSAADTTAETPAVTAPKSGIGSRAVAIAFRYEGVPYAWGGLSPRGFDCSGFTKYVYGQLGIGLGRTVADQRDDVRIVSRSQAKPGDLVIFGNSHIGIYLGDGYMIDAPHRGATVQKRKIYSPRVSFGRVA